RTAPPELRARGDRHRVPLVGSADVVEAGRIDDVVDERLEVGAGHAGVEPETQPARRLHEAIRPDHRAREDSTRRAGTTGGEPPLGGCWWTNNQFGTLAPPHLGGEPWPVDRAPSFARW